MPQLDINTFAPQLIWLAISFITLYLIMSRLALPRVGAILEERSGRLAGDLAEAARLRDETTKALADYEHALADARARGQAIAAKARDELTADIARQRQAVDEQIAGKIAEAETRISAVTAEASTHIGEIATETAQAVVVRLLGRTIDSAEVAGAVNEALGK